MSGGPTVIAPRTDADFLDRILVDCPACGGLAVIRLEQEGGDYKSIAFGPRRMTCTRCAAHRTQPAAALSNPTMGLTLRLRGDGRHGSLYAYNEDHLDHIETIVASPLRQEKIEPGGYRNKTVASRLPHWVKSAAGRDDVLKLIAKMRARLG